MAESVAEKDEFLVQHKDFSLREEVCYPNGGMSRFYDNGVDMVIIDDGICKHSNGETIFSYMLITDKQNDYMHQFKRVYRFLGYKRSEVDSYLSRENDEFEIGSSRPIGDRGEQVDVTPLELHFEFNFTNVYGMNALKYLTREYGICDDKGNNYFLDYFVRTKDQKIAVEENGVTYHHPQIIGEERYRKQLEKQNTCALWGIKLYRFSSEDLAYDNRIDDDIKRFFGKDSSQFITDGIKLDRKVEIFELYEHQTFSLEEISKSRNAGIKAFLLVLPTASGKSRIVVEDLKKYSEENPHFRALIITPTVNVRDDWRKRVEESFADFSKQIEVTTFARLANHYTATPSDYYDYLVFDEAHHAVAPVAKRVIQYFNTKFLIGLTATDQRPDRKKLEEVFGSYSSSLSLKEAMEKGIVATANVFRIETNIDLSHVRFNGKDYVNADLEHSIRVTSRNELIADVLSKYFTEGEASKRQGVIFCVNVAHANEMSKLLNSVGISAVSYTRQTRNISKVMEDFKEKKIRFLCSCNMISEGWDYPELGILVMARPTLSKVLYMQQIGRGLRKTDTKKNVIVIDVVDEYGSMVRACSMHSLFGIHYYVPFGDITRTDYKPDEMVVIDGITERIEKIVEVDINSFDEKYGDYLSQEQVAREYFVSTGTVTSWIKKGKVVPSVKYPFGNQYVYLFSPEDVAKYKVELNIKDHNDSTIKQDFFDFVEERDYSLSYKMPFLMALIDEMDSIGDAKIENVLDRYIKFYNDRIMKGIPVDRKTCPYNSETLQDRKMIRSNMLANPFEKFERKRFMYYSKDLSVISVNHALFSQMTKDDWNRVKEQMMEDLKDYYKDLGGI